jgi:hypothetical protein
LKAHYNFAGQDINHQDSEINMLCHICQNIDYDQLNIDFRASLDHQNAYRHHRNYAALSRSAASGCDFCAAIIRGVENTADAADKLLKDRDRKKQILLRLTDATDYEKTNLEVYYRDGMPLTEFGLFIERTAREWETALWLVTLDDAACLC